MTYPRVSEILKEMVLFDEPDLWWLKPRYLRRGRLVDHCASILASGRSIEPEWFKGHSGESDDDRVEHEEVRPYLDSVRQFLSEHQFILEHAQCPVVNQAERYMGHPDWLGLWVRHDPIVIDLKCGEPPPEYLNGNGTKRRNPLYDAYRRQVALYKLAAPEPYCFARRAILHIYPGGYQFIEHTDRGELGRAIAMVRAFHDRQQYKRAA